MILEEMPAFQTVIPVRFDHVDPVGIVYYPRYFQMLAEVVEIWFEEALGINYRQFHLEENRCIPLVDVHCRFIKPSWLTERLIFKLLVSRLGTSSMVLNISAFGAGERRLEADMTIIYAIRDGQTISSVDIPAQLREKMERFSAS